MSRVNRAGRHMKATSLVTFGHTVPDEIIFQNFYCGGAGANLTGTSNNRCDSALMRVTTTNV